MFTGLSAIWCCAGCVQWGFRALLCDDNTAISKCTLQYFLCSCTLRTCLCVNPWNFHAASLERLKMRSLSPEPGQELFLNPPATLPFNKAAQNKASSSLSFSLFSCHSPICPSCCCFSLMRDALICFYVFMGRLNLPLTRSGCQQVLKLFALINPLITGDLWTVYSDLMSAHPFLPY